MKKFDISSAALHILAMAFMLLDHLWATVVPGNDWLTCVGRLAFPIFVFCWWRGSFTPAAGKSMPCGCFSPL